MYKAIFFDRDGTLTYFNLEKETWRNHAIESWSGRKFNLPYKKMMTLFALSAGNRVPWYRTVDEEREFFRCYYKHLLIGEGVTEQIDSRANLLFAELWCNNDRLPYSEVTEVLEYFRCKGYKMGVISDTSPSLEYTLQQLDLAKYFTSFTTSSLVGAGKPNPVIFNAALAAQKVTAEESLYVDDCEVEADGARKLGFTSFFIDRTGQENKPWTITSLRNLIDYIETR